MMTAARFKEIAAINKKMAKARLRRDERLMREAFLDVAKLTDEEVRCYAQQPFPKRSGR